MTAPIGAVTLPTAPTFEATKSIDSTVPTDLAGSFVHSLAEARKTEAAAETASTKFANGDPSVGIHEVMIETEKASISLRYATTLKNKALEAYRELMNTQV